MRWRLDYLLITVHQTGCETTNHPSMSSDNRRPRRRLFLGCQEFHCCRFPVVSLKKHAGMSASRACGHAWYRGSVPVTAVMNELAIDDGEGRPVRSRSRIINHAARRAGRQYDGVVAWQWHWHSVCPNPYLSSSHQGSRPVRLNRRCPVPIYRFGLVGYRSEPGQIQI